RFAPPVKIGARFVLHRLRVDLEPGIGERGMDQPQLLVHQLRLGVIRHALSEDGNGELISFASRELLVGSSKEGGVGGRPRVDVHPLPGQAKAKALAELLAPAPEKLDGAPGKRGGVAEPWPAAGQDGRELTQSLPFLGTKR